MGLVLGVLLNSHDLTGNGMLPREASGASSSGVPLDAPRLLEGGGERQPAPVDLELSLGQPGAEVGDRMDLDNLPLTPHAPAAIPHAEQAMDDPEAPPVVALDLDSLPDQWIFDHKKKIGDLIREFRKEERIKRPAPEKVEEIISRLLNSMVKEAGGGIRIKSSRSFFKI